MSFVLAVAIAALLGATPPAPAGAAGPGPSPSPRAARGFTVREYRIYRSVATAPSFMTEDEVLKRTARQFNITTAQARRVGDRVKTLLLKNRWFGPPENEIRHAWDWKGENP